MRYSASEKFEIIRLVEQSNLSVRQTLLRLGIRTSTFYNWLKRYYEGGMDGLEGRKPSPINYYLPSELEERIRRFVDYYNHERYHKSLSNLTPADVYYGRGQAILDKKEKIKQQT
jgi:transposase-like protein